MSLRADLALEVLRRKRPVRELAAKYGVSRPTAHKWAKRLAHEGRAGMQTRSRRPHHSPDRTPEPIADFICALRDARPTWGPEKLYAFATDCGTLGVPPPRTAARILKRRDRIRPRKPAPSEITHFQYPHPNDLWQIDFKRAVGLSCCPPRKAIPMSIVDDHSRFSIGLWANPDRQLDTIWPLLWEALGEYGMPLGILTDNDCVFRGRRGGLSAWTARLLRLGITHTSGRGYHPQPQGKVERLHGTIQTDALAEAVFRSPEQLQVALDEFRDIYNHQRPHAALNLQVPADHYQPSPRTRPERIPALEYPEGAVLRKVMNNGAISVRSCRIDIGEGITGHYVRLHDQHPWLEIEYAGHTVRRLRWDELRPDRWI